MKIGLKVVISLLSLVSLMSCGSSQSSNHIPSTKYEIVDASAQNIKTKDGFMVTPFNTVVTLRTFSEFDYVNSYKTFNDEVQRLHILFDRYNDFVDDKGNDIINLKDINESYGTNKKLVVDQDIINLLKLSIELSELTEGYFNPTIGELIDTWNYRYEDGEKYTRFSPYCFEDIDPEVKDIESSKLKAIPYNELSNYLIVNDDDNTVEFKKYKDIDKVTLSLGAIAKGYAVESVKALISEICASAMIDGGSSSSYGIGKNPNPERDYWLVGLAAPYKVMMSVQAIANLRFDDTYTLSVSGDYESCYKTSDGTIRHHILNPYTGYPESNYRVVSLKSDQHSEILDGLSTALFNIESTDKIVEIVKNVEKHFNMDIAILLEKEVDKENKKIDLYITENYDSHIVKVNSKYYNNKYYIGKGE